MTTHTTLKLSALALTAVLSQGAQAAQGTRVARTPATAAATTADAATPSRRALRRSARQTVRAGGVAVRPARQAAWSQNLVMTKSFAAWNHQAGPNEFGENTIDGFARGQKMGLMHDTDLNTSKDGVLVMHHDPVTGKHTNVAGVELGKVTWATIQRDVRTIAPDGSRHPIARFEDLLAAFPGQPISVEVKSMDAARALVKVVKARPELKQQGIFHAFSDEAVKYMRTELGPDLVTSLSTKETLKFLVVAKIPVLRNLVRIKTDGDVVAMPANLGQLKPFQKLPGFIKNPLVVSSKTVQVAHRNGLKLHAWTVNDPVQMRELVQRGVDGLWSNAPTALAEVQHDMTHTGAP